MTATPHPTIVLSSEQQGVMEDAIERLLSRREASIGGLAGTGKAQPLSATVWTPTGPKKMGDIKVGDRVLNPHGSYSVCIGVFPQGVKDVYEITMRDGSKTRATLDHLWQYRIARSPTPFRVGTTQILINLLNEGRSVLLPVTKPVGIAPPPIRWSDPRPIDPYVLGALIGDGGYTTNAVILTTVDEEILNEVKGAIPAEWTLTPTDEIGYRFKTGGAIRRMFQSLGIMGQSSSEKVIPESYLHAPKTVRLALLQGLMDTDGSVDVNGGIEFSSTSQKLAEQVQWLIRSLGGTATMSSRPTFYKSEHGERIDCKTSYRLYVAATDTARFFRLTRKKERCKPFNGYDKEMGHRIQSIVLVGREECQCIQLDAVDGLYVTDDFIVTHNTTLLKHILATLREEGHLVAVVAFTGKAVSVLRKKGIPDAQTMHSLMYAPRSFSVWNDETEKYETETHWERRDSIGVDTVIVDEASMVSTSLLEDLRAFNVRILFVGDHGQLEPVGDNPGVMLQPNFILKQIHRQAAGNPIIDFAHNVREGGHPFASFDPSKKDARVEVRAKSTLRVDDLVNADQVICGFNKTRRMFNRRIRARMGRTGTLVPGERIICLRNKRDQGLFNGMMLTVDEITEETADVIKFVATSDDGHVFDDLSALKKDFDGVSDSFEFDYGYVITAHKSQGSEAGHVVVIEEIWTQKWDPRRWRYTAATRAAEKLTYFA